MSPEDFEVPKYPVIERVSGYGVKRLICIGDIHGCFEEFTELWASLEVTDNDMVVFLGDLVDRGPRGPETVASVHQLCEQRPMTYCVLGNHDEKHVRYRKHVVKKCITPSYQIPMRTPPEGCFDMPDRDLAWMAKLPGVIELDPAFGPGFTSRIMTHAGIIAGLEYRQPTSGLIRNRYVLQHADGVWKPVGLGPDLTQPGGSRLWDEFWNRQDRVIYGHIVHSLTSPRVHNNCYGIDTGCCFGGRLTAYVEDRTRVDDGVFVYVDAKKAYATK